MNNELKVIEVVAAIIMKDNKILATKRGYGEFKGGWEFPGGKMEKDETDEQALVREIKEEMNVDITVKEFLATVEHEYPTFYLIMHTYICNLEDDKLEKIYHNDTNELEHEDAIWLSMDELDTVNWLPADIKVVDEIRKRNKRYSGIIN